MTYPARYPEIPVPRGLAPSLRPGARSGVRAVRRRAHHCCRLRASAPVEAAVSAGSRCRSQSGVEEHRRVESRAAPIAQEDASRSPPATRLRRAHDSQGCGDIDRSWFVAAPATKIWLLLQAPPSPKEKPGLPAVAPARPPPALRPTGKLHQLM
jgi:hypothetical protein